MVMFKGKEAVINNFIRRGLKIKQQLIVQYNKNHNFTNGMILLRGSTVPFFEIDFYAF